MTPRNSLSPRPRHPGPAQPRRLAGALLHLGQQAAALFLLLLLPLLTLCFAPQSRAQAAPDATLGAQPGLKVCAIIVEARAVPGGAALRFHETTGMNFEDSLGNRGYINGRKVIRYAREPNDPDLPAQPTLTVQSGATLTLYENHSGCTVVVATVDGRTVLKIRRSISLPGIPPQVEEAEVPLQ